MTTWTDEQLDEAFTSPVTGQPYDVPADIRAAATSIVRSYPIRGICDPMYIANVIARDLGRGDGQSHFGSEHRCPDCSSWSAIASTTCPRCGAPLADYEGVEVR